MNKYIIPRKLRKFDTLEELCAYQQEILPKTNEIFLLKFKVGHLYIYKTKKYRSD